MPVTREQIIRELKELQGGQLICKKYITIHGQSSHSINWEKLADDWEKWLPEISPKELCNFFDGLRLEQGRPKVKVSFNEDDRPAYNGCSIGLDHEEWQRKSFVDAVEFELKDDYVQIRSAFLPEHLQEQGHIRKIMQFIIKLAEMRGTKQLALTAAGDNGGYSWARLRFVPNTTAETGRDTTAWDRVKEQLKDRLNKDRTRIIWPALDKKLPAAEAERVHRFHFPYAERFPDGFALTPIETTAINEILAREKPIPEDLWVLSDMGRKLAVIPRDDPGKPPHIVTVGKALLCGVTWMGTRDLTPGSPGLDEFMQYLARVPERNVTAEKGRG